MSAPRNTLDLYQHLQPRGVRQAVPCSVVDLESTTLREGGWIAKEAPRTPTSVTAFKLSMSKRLGRVAEVTQMMLRGCQ